MSSAVWRPAKAWRAPTARPGPDHDRVADQGLQAQQQFLPQIADLQGQALQFGQNAVGAQTQLGQNQLNFLQGINQQGPDYNTLAQLATAIGTGGTGYGQNSWNALPQFPRQSVMGSIGGAQFQPMYGQQQLSYPPQSA